MAERQGPFYCRVSEGDSLLEMCPGGGVFAQEEQGRPERVMRLQAVRRVGLALRQPIELFPERPRSR
jgi:hypothetical protein